MFVEALYGFLTNSLGLISDSAHMFFDCVALFIGLIASVISKKPANSIYSFGYGRVEVLSGFVNGLFLIFIAILVLMESIERLYHPQDIKEINQLIAVSILGLFVNLIGVFAFHDLHDHGETENHSHHHHHNHHHDHDIKKGKSNANTIGVYLHIIADALGSVGVIISSLIIKFFGFIIADPICSFCISVLIFVSVIPLLKSSSMILLQCTPPDIEKKLDKYLLELTKIEGIINYRNPHFWRHNKDLIVGTIHIQIDNKSSEQKILSKVITLFKNKGIKNLTIEISKDSSFILPTNDFVKIF